MPKQLKRRSKRSLRKKTGGKRRIKVSRSPYYLSIGRHGVSWRKRSSRKSSKGK